MKLLEKIYIIGRVKIEEFYYDHIERPILRKRFRKYRNNVIKQWKEVTDQ